MKTGAIMLYSIYDSEGKLSFTTPSHKGIKDKLSVSYSSISIALQRGWKIKQHTVVVSKVNKKPPETIELEKSYPKFLDITDDKLKRMYLVYHLDGTIALEKPMYMKEITAYLNITKHTIMDGINKNHLCNGHIVKVARSRTKFPKKLSPVAKEFKVFKYNKEGDLVAWYTTISVASRLTKIDYDVIRNCIVKAVSTHKQYYFTNHIPLSGYKKIKVSFKTVNKPYKVLVSQGIQHNNVLMSLTQASKHIGTTYITLKKKIDKSPRIMFKGFVIEKAKQ